ncbi:hypothetical protein IAT38_003454 [Cryptococcus sp. DSM 104549]
MDPAIPTTTSPSSFSPSSTSQPPLPQFRNPKHRHVSRSAAKRESVQLLGSIQDLRMQFSQVQVSHKAGAGAGIRGGGGGLGSVGEDEEEENRPPGDRTSGTSSRERRERKPWKEVDLPRVDPETARKEARSIVTSIREIWGLSLPASPSSATSLPSSRSLYFSTSTNLASLAGGSGNGGTEAGGEENRRTSESIQAALVTTARSIRRIRFLALSVSHQNRHVSGPTLLPAPRASKLRTSFSTPSRPGAPLPRTVSGGAPRQERRVSGGPRGSLGASVTVDGRRAGGEGYDALADLRRAALEVLTTLRALEERLRLFQTRPEHDLPPDLSRALSPGATSTSGSDRTAPTPTTTTSAPNSTSVLSSEPEYMDSEYDSDEYNLNALAQEDDADAARAAQPWEERIVVEQREYRVLEGPEWEKEARGTREGVGKWVGVVERLFVVAGKGGETELEGWVKEEGWEGNMLGRLHAFLLSHLPIDLSLLLPPPSAPDFASNMLSALSDGYILIHAYNSALLASSKPWGFIPDEDVHDTLSFAGGEAERKDKEWTFRRVGNLTCWGAALRHRYQLPVQMPSSTSTSAFLNKPSALPARTSSAASSGRSSPAPGTTFSPTLKHSALPPITTTPSPAPSPAFGASSATRGKDVPRIEFDPMTIAKKADGWEGMLEEVVGKWVEGVSREIREVRAVRAGREEGEGRAGLGRGGMI